MSKTLRWSPALIAFIAGMVFVYNCSSDRGSSATGQAANKSFIVPFAISASFAQTNYSSFGGVFIGPSEVTAQLPIARDMQIVSAWITVQENNADATATLTLRVNGQATPFTTSIAAGSTPQVQLNPGNTRDMLAGDQFSVQLTVGGSSGGLRINGFVELL